MMVFIIFLLLLLLERIKTFFFFLLFICFAHSFNHRSMLYVVLLNLSVERKKEEYYRHPGALSTYKAPRSQKKKEIQSSQSCNDMII
jgi:hypothetical protein